VSPLKLKAFRGKGKALKKRRMRRTGALTAEVVPSLALM